MKKLSVLLALLCLMCVAVPPSGAWFLTDDFEPIAISSNGTSAASPSRYRIDKPVSIARNCFTDLSVSASNFPTVFTLSILEGPTTALTTSYMVDITTGPFNKSWPSEYPLCLTPGTTGYVQISGANATWKINVNGLIKKK